MRRYFLIIMCSLSLLARAAAEKGFPSVNAGEAGVRQFALYDKGVAATICTDSKDFTVVGIAASLLADDVERVTGGKLPWRTPHG